MDSNLNLNPEKKQEPEPEPMATPEPEPEPEPESESKPALEPETIPVTSAYHLAEEPKEAAIQSDKHESNEQNASGPAELQQNRTLTMRELLTELKIEEGDDAASTPLSQQSTQQRLQNNAAMELINNVTSTDEEGRSRLRVLTFATRRYASAGEKSRRL